MNIRRISGILALLCAFGISNVNAQNNRYFSLFGGFGELEDYDFVGPATFEGTFKDGWGIGLATGARLTEALRGEFEFSFREVEGDDWIVNGNPGKWSGDAGAGSLMTNLILDLDCLSIGPIRPYGGAGVGLSMINGDMTTAVGTLDVNETNFAWQAIAGGAIARGNHEIFAEYRYMDSGSVDIVNGAGTSIGQEDVNTNYGMFGVRFYR